MLGLHKGVCPDSKVGGVDNYQINTYTRMDGLTKLTYRRNLINTGLLKNFRDNLEFTDVLLFDDQEMKGIKFSTNKVSLN